MKHLLWVVGFVLIFTCVSVVTDAADFEDSSIEVGFIFDGEPEPRFLVVAEEGQAKLFEVEKEPKETGKILSIDQYNKRLLQVVETERFFSARQARPQPNCVDRYILKVRVGKKVRERRGCSNQADDVFAGFTQNMYRDTFQAWKQKDGLNDAVRVATE